MYWEICRGDKIIENYVKPVDQSTTKHNFLEMLNIIIVLCLMYSALFSIHFMASVENTIPVYWYTTCIDFMCFF